ncbi:WD40 repeat-like protein [Lentinus tigrinus ALCF2SS1-7]|uniref:WD40 repeat-like protein n=1 Tax=Lentinus tigrinus ALCF2SS1-7 TaxID=1328758 RepID=UPI0011662626|nr:WD40 repeat-like protein [Lentinus tigrinus ALCF2SS1-7]
MNTTFRSETLHSWDIYAQQLFHHGHGQAIWLPDPDPTAREVQIGDVGWMREGTFLQLFNAMKSEDKQPVLYGVPEEYTPFDPPNLIVSGPQERILQRFLYSRTVREVDVSSGASAGAPLPIPTVSGGASFNFKCGADVGAFLVFSPKSYSMDIESKRHVVNYIRANFTHWLAFADKFGLEKKDQDLFFVCGTTKTSRWARAAFRGQYKKKQGTITADFSSAAGLNLSVSISNQSLPTSSYGAGPTRRARSPTLSTVVSASGSPDAEGADEPIDQCIFIHYYKVKRRIWGNKVMKAAAGPHDLPSPDPDEGSVDPVAEDDSGSDDEGRSQEYFDPVNELLDYILENSEASIAIASDRDLYALFKDQEFPDDITAALYELQPSVELDEHGVGTVSAAIDFSKKTTADEPDPADVPQETPADPSAHPQQGADGPSRPESPTHVGDDEESLRKIITYGAPTSIHDGSVTALTYSADGKYAASGSEDTTIILWDVPTNNALHKLSGHCDTVSSLAFSRDNEYLASGSNDEKVILWRVQDGQEDRRLSPGVPIHTVAYTPDGSKLIAGAYNGSLIIWETEGYQQLRVITKHLAVITFIVFSPDGRLMATGGTESDCYIWDLETLGQGEPKSVLQGHKGMVCSAAFSPDRNRIVTASDDGSARVWKTETGEALVILHEHTGPVWTVAFSPDGKRVASGSSDSTVKVCDSFSGERIFSLDGHDSMINAVQFSPGGQFIASAASDNTVRLWNAADGSCVATFNEHSDNVTTVLFSPTDGTLVSGSHDGTVRIRPLMTI